MSQAVTQAMIDDPLVWIVPCFDEESRIDAGAFFQLIDQEPSTSLIFVDDGSRDRTLIRLREIADQRPERIFVVALPRNQGKAEAIRQGMLQALAGAADIVGFADADFATPPAELRRLAELIRQGNHDVVMGSRVQLLGRSIQRRALRHYVGRLFATCASLSLGLPVYDTQCGAKLFRRGPALGAAVATRFRSRWAFDVELLGRLLRPRDGVSCVPIERVWEEPLRAWTDVPGSKLSAVAGLRTIFELARIGWDLRRRKFVAR
jgi:dolichyl-phosphate beta-glucosyltransferase